jgi:hypothetical protein
MSTNRAFGNFEKFKKISLKMYVQVLFYFFPGNFLEIVCPGMYPPYDFIGKAMLYNSIETNFKCHSCRFWRRRFIEFTPHGSFTGSLLATKRRRV